MIISPNSLTALVNEGYLTLQVPEYSIDLGSSSAEIQQDYPDEWFCYLQSNNSPCVGKKEGFLYFTRSGYMANKELLKTAFETAIANGLDRTNGVGWAAFEQYAKEHFEKIEKQKLKKIKALQKQLNELAAFQI